MRTLLRATRAERTAVLEANIAADKMDDGREKSIEMDVRNQFRGLNQLKKDEMDDK